ncbi:hypothetical protein [Gordonia spumicola]|nr:hypothetical protein [Gordonia spumicola]
MIIVYAVVAFVVIAAAVGPLLVVGALRGTPGRVRRRMAAGLIATTVVAGCAAAAGGVDVLEFCVYVIEGAVLACFAFTPGVLVSGIGALFTKRALGSTPLVVSACVLIVAGLAIDVPRPVPWDELAMVLLGVALVLVPVFVTPAGRRRDTPGTLVETPAEERSS